MIPALLFPGYNFFSSLPWFDRIVIQTLESLKERYFVLNRQLRFLFLLCINVFSLPILTILEVKMREQNKSTDIFMYKKWKLNGMSMLTNLELAYFCFEKLNYEPYL